MPRQKQPADEIDAQLARYRGMRDFAITAEPAGTGTRLTPERRSMQWPFVIQKHAASHLHYDFRLGWNGVLKSWACAKGPSYSVKDRRLAVQVEDHPIEYGGFEGIIPAGQYGGGTVMVWDQGTWSTQPGHEDVDAGLREGNLKFKLNGTKMHGKWALIRMHDKPADKGKRWGSSGKPNWLLIKEHDDFEQSPESKPVTEAEPNSAVTGRSLEQIAIAEDHVWQSNKSAYLRDPSLKIPKDQPWHRNPDKVTSPKTAATSKSKKANVASVSKSVVAKEALVTFNQSANGAPLTSLGRRPRSTTPTNGKGLKARPIGTSAETNPAAWSHLPTESQPTFIKPQLAQEATTPPEGTNWLHELKLDGYRIQARKSATNVKLLTRSGLDWTHRIPTLASALAQLPMQHVTLDGELVVLGPDGNSSFAELQASFQESISKPLTYFAFDLLHIEGRNPRELSLRQRKEMLAGIVPAGNEEIRISEHLETSGAAMFHHACQLHAEGIISKRADAPYRHGRNPDWLKSKCLHEQEFVIAGYTLSSDGDDRIGSLLLGYYDDSENLIYAGRTGTGFTQKLRRSLLTQLSTLQTPKPFLRKISTADRRGALWIKPALVAQVRFATWTAEDLVRQAAFLGLREDKTASEVRREHATSPPLPKHRQSAPSTLKSSTLATSPRTQTPRLTHPDKVLDAESGLTKQQLAEYYAAIAPHILPHIADRPISLVRCPDGAGKPCFFQKHVNKMLPSGIGTIEVPDKKTGKLEPYITLNSPDQLISLAQLGVLEIHPWGSKNTDLEHPDRLILDLDPDASVPWSILCSAAKEIRKLLMKNGLQSFLKLTGGKGLHVVAPITPTLSWTNLKQSAHTLVLSMERSRPDLYLTKMSKAARKDKIYLDYLRNERGATAVAPFSPRARPGVHVSLPVPWSSLKLSQRPIYPAKEFQRWAKSLRSDPWKSMLSIPQQLDPSNFHDL